MYFYGNLLTQNTLKTNIEISYFLNKLQFVKFSLVKASLCDSKIQEKYLQISLALLAKEKDLHISLTLLQNQPFSGCSWMEGESKGLKSKIC